MARPELSHSSNPPLGKARVRSVAGQRLSPQHQIRNPREELASQDPKAAFRMLMRDINVLDSLGKIDEAVLTAEKAHLLVAEYPESIPIRQLHNTIGMLHYRLCKYDSSSYHLIQALRIAKLEKSTLHEFAALANIACLLNSLGLVDVAVSLSRKLCSYPKKDISYLKLHLQTAVNAVKFGCSARLASSDLKLFYDTLIDLSRSSHEFTPLENAYVFAGQVMYALGEEGNQPLIKELKKNLIHFASDRGPRVNAVILFTRARIALGSKDNSEMTEIISSVSELLPKVEEFPEYFEEALEVLLSLYETLRLDVKPTDSSLELATLLREHVIGVKKKTFVNSIHLSKKRTECGVATIFDKRQYRFEWLDMLKTEVAQYVEPFPAERNYEIDELHDQCNLLGLARLINEQTGTSFDRGFRCEAYDVSENWAIASELRVGGNGRMLFTVGELAYLTAKAYGCREKLAVQIGMACRLRDVAQIVISSEHIPAGGTALEDDFLWRQHATCGADMLEHSGEFELRRYSKIIRHHHEWWNGCGYPSGLRGDSIPLGSRICAYADAFVSLFFGEKNKDDSWSQKEALDQVKSMCGMQLDPNLYQPFLSAVLGMETVGSFGVSLTCN